MYHKEAATLLTSRIQMATLINKPVLNISDTGTVSTCLVELYIDVLIFINVYLYLNYVSVVINIIQTLMLLLHKHQSLPQSGII